MAKKENKLPEIIEEKIINKPLGRAIHEYMMPYAEYIILERALPRVEDGLKPVQRRILYSMHELNLKPDGPFKKCARVVGDCLGKYHPHGDSSIYGALVNMAQDFSMRMRLVHGHGNFGSIDGDSAAAMRYTEAKMDNMAIELLRDLEKDTVKWGKNFDDSLDEPLTLPGRFPNLLVNGAEGIAIGLATKIPPHNLTEIIDACVAMLDKPHITLEELLGIVKGPDFPTGGFIIADKATLLELYETGSGRIPMRAKVDIQPSENGKQQIVITEIPYGINKADLQQDILKIREDAVESKKDLKLIELLNGIQEIADESDRHGISVVIRLKKGTDATALLDVLYKKTNLQCNFSANMVAIADGRPQQLGLIQILKYYLAYQRNVIYKRSMYDLDVANRRAHILEGYVKILNDIDGVVALIKSSNSRNEAKEKLREKYDLSEKQADAVLDLRLAHLTKLEITKIESELRELQKLIAKLLKIVGSVKEQDKVVCTELLEIRDKYKSKRLTTVVTGFADIEDKPFEVAGNTSRRGYVVAGHNGTAKFVNPLSFHSFKGIPSKPAEIATQLVLAEKDTQTLVISNLGNAFKINTAEIKDSTMNAEGKRLCELFNGAEKDEKAVSVINYPENNPTGELLLFTAKGDVKRMLIRDCVVSRENFSVYKLTEDEIINAEIKRENTSLIFLTSDGMCVNVDAEEVSMYKREAGGVIGISLNEKERVLWAGQNEIEDGESLGEIVLISDKGFAKRVFAAEAELGKRGRKGVKVIDSAAGKIIFAGVVTNAYPIAIIGGDNKITMIETEDILIDRNRLGKGKPFKASVGAISAHRHHNAT